MKITSREPVDATPEQAIAILTDEAFLDLVCRETTLGGPYQVQVERTASGTRVTTERELPSDQLPDLARSFIGGNLVVTQVDNWGPAGSDGTITATTSVQVKGAPVTLTGTRRLTPTAGGSELTLDADLKANVPFMGSKIEQAASGPLRLALDVEVTQLREKLAR